MKAREVERKLRVNKKRTKKLKKRLDALNAFLSQNLTPLIDAHNKNYTTTPLALENIDGCFEEVDLLDFAEWVLSKDRNERLLNSKTSANDLPMKDRLKMVELEELEYWINKFRGNE